MSAEARAWAKRQRTGSPAAKSVLVALADYAGSEHGECWPSQAALARDTELSERAVRKHLQALEDAGFIQREQRNRKSGGRTSDLILLDLKDERERHQIPGGARHHVPGGARHHVPGAPAPRSGEPLKEPSVTISEEIVGRAREAPAASDAPCFALTPPERSPPKRGTRLPDNWQPSERDMAFATGAGLSEEEARHEADQFRDFWIAASGARACKRDWAAAWRTWVRNAVTWRKERTRPGNGRRGPASSAEAFMRGAGLDPDALG